MSLTLVFLLYYTFILYLDTSTCLPVTSKPIENTPEHLAWEAWIMVPPSNDKTRKITPKSIFIVPNGTNGGNGGSVNGDSSSSSIIDGSGNGKGSSPTYMPQIQCPPGHTVDNVKCIPTVSIDQNQILITRLTNLLHHATDKYNGSGMSELNENNYDYDYEYDTYETDDAQPFPHIDGSINENNKNINNNKSPLSSDYNGEPLKINLSFGKFPSISESHKEVSVDSNKNNGDNKFNFGINEGISSAEKNDNIAAATTGTENVDNDNDEIKIQPFRGEETSSTTTSSTTTAKTAKSTNNFNDDDVSATNYFQGNPGSTTTIKTPSSSSSDSETSGSTTSITSNTATNTPATFEFTISDRFSPVYTSTVITNSTTSSIPILSSSESEMLTKSNNDNNSTTIDAQDYDLDGDDQSTSRTTTTVDDELELVTNLDDTPKIDDINNDMVKDSLIIQPMDTTKTTSIDKFNETTEFEEQIHTTTPLLHAQIEDDRTDTIYPDELDLTDITQTKVSTKKSSSITTTPVSQISTRNEQQTKLHKKRFEFDHNSSSDSKSQTDEAIDGYYDAAPIMETIESNNRYIYHHLGTINSNLSQSNIDNISQPTPTEATVPSTTTTTISPDIRQQLSIINKIVEENKKRIAASSLPSTVASSNEKLLNFFANNRNENIRSTSSSLPTNSRVISSMPPLAFHHKPSIDPYYSSLLDRRLSFPSQLPLLPPIQSSVNSAAANPTASTIGNINTGDIQHQQQNTKQPFWWLPTGWEVDRTGDRPMLVRFWSRVPAPAEPSSLPSSSSSSSPASYIDASTIIGRHRLSSTPSSLLPSSSSLGLSPQSSLSSLLISSSPSLIPVVPTTTTKYRSNSRSPTENLYRQEVTAQQQQQHQQQQQDIYRVLGTKQWKHNNR